MKLLSLCSGYGGAEFSLNLAKIPYEIVGFSEIDKYAIQCYNQNHKNIDSINEYGQIDSFSFVPNYGDLIKINPKKLPNFDLLTAGFPCQAFSQAGKQLGDKDIRGQIIYYILKIIEEKKPKYILLENVKGFTQKKFKNMFDFVLNELDRIGYYVKWKVLNSKDYIVPQNRERVFFVCYRKDLKKQFIKFEFPKPLRNFENKKIQTLEQFKEKIPNSSNISQAKTIYYKNQNFSNLNTNWQPLILSDILKKEVDEKYYLSDLSIERHKRHNNFYNQNNKLSKTIISNYFKDRKNNQLIKEYSNFLIFLIKKEFLQD